MSSHSLRTERKKFAPRPKSAAAKQLKNVEVRLDKLEIKLAVKLGDGDLILGIRRAVILAGMHQL